MNERFPAVRAISHRQLEEPRIEESSEVFRRPSFPTGVHGANPYPNLIGQQGVVGRIQAARQMFRGNLPLVPSGILALGMPSEASNFIAGTDVTRSYECFQSNGCGDDVTGSELGPWRGDIPARDGAVVCVG
jgi:hypothetical protein